MHVVTSSPLGSRDTRAATSDRSGELGLGFVARLVGHRATPPVVFVATAIALWPLLGDRPVGPDAVSYFSIAQSWAAGRWGDALNAFWSPLFSWLLVPAAWLDLSLVDASLAMSIVIGAFTLWRLRILLDRLQISETVSGILAMAAAPFLVHAVYGFVTPDLLMAALLLGYVDALVDSDGAHRGIRVGGWAAAAVLAKIYALPFVLAHLTCWVLVRTWRREAGDATLRTSVTAVSVVGAAVAGWMIALGAAYPAPTLSTSATYHVSVATPGSPGTGFGWAGLLEPPNSSATSAWEEPSLSPFERQERATQVETGVYPDGIDVRVRRNAIDVAMAGASLIGIASLALIGAVGVIIRGRHRSSSEPAVHLVSAVLVYSAGLTVLFVERRYLFFVLLLTVPLAGWYLARTIEPRRGTTAAAIVAVVAGVASVPLSIVGLMRVAERAGDAHVVVEELGRVVSHGERIASSDVDLLALNEACYEIGCIYLGSPLERSGLDLLAELCRHDVDVYLDVDGSAGLPSTVRRLDPISTTYDQAWQLSDAKGLDCESP